MRYLNRWWLSCLWVAAMIAVWFTFVPNSLSLSTWVLATLAGAVLLVGGAAFFESGRPTPSFRQSQAVAEARDAAAAAVRRLL